MKLKSSSEAQKLAAEKLLKNCLALKLKSSSEAPKLAAEKLLKNCNKSLSGIRSRSSKTVSEVEKDSCEVQKFKDELLKNC